LQDLQAAAVLIERAAAGGIADLVRRQAFDEAGAQIGQTAGELRRAQTDEGAGVEAEGGVGAPGGVIDDDVVLAPRASR